jgi:hypothetical protein
VIIDIVGFSKNKQNSLLNQAGNSSAFSPKSQIAYRPKGGMRGILREGTTPLFPAPVSGDGGVSRSIGSTILFRKRWSIAATAGHRTNSSARRASGVAVPARRDRGPVLDSLCGDGIPFRRCEIFPENRFDGDDIGRAVRGIP